MRHIPFVTSLPWTMYLANGASKKTEKKGPLEELILPFYFTNECTYTILHAFE